MLLLEEIRYKQAAMLSSMIRLGGLAAMVGGPRSLGFGIGIVDVLVGSIWGQFWVDSGRDVNRSALDPGGLRLAPSGGTKGRATSKSALKR